MKELRVLLAIDSPLFSDALQHLLGREANVVLVGHVTDPVDLLVEVRRTRANVVIHSWPNSGQMPGICSHLLDQFPELLVIAIPSDSNHIVTCRKTIVISEFPDSGMEEVLFELRRARQNAERVLT